MLRHGETALGQKPEGVAVQPSAMGRRVRVGRRVGGGVMLPVMPRPPQRPPLAGGGAEQRHDELRDASRPEGSMREVAVVEGGDEEHPRDIERQCDEQGERAAPNPKDAEAQKMHGDERARPHGGDAVAFGFVQAAIQSRLLAEPTQHPRQRAQQADGAHPSKRGFWLGDFRHAGNDTALRVKLR